MNNSTFTTEGGIKIEKAITPLDAEHALDPSWARKIGVNLEELLVSQPSYGEEALQIAEMLIHSNAVDIIVVDSVAALVPKVELDGEIGDRHVGIVVASSCRSENVMLF